MYCNWGSVKIRSIWRISIVYCENVTLHAQVFWWAVSSQLWTDFYVSWKALYFYLCTSLLLKLEFCVISAKDTPFFLNRTGEYKVNLRKIKSYIIIKAMWVIWDLSQNYMMSSRKHFLVLLYPNAEILKAGLCICVFLIVWVFFTLLLGYWIQNVRKLGFHKNFGSSRNSRKQTL